MDRGLFETTKIWWFLICSQWPVPNSDYNATGLSRNHLEWGKLSAVWLTREPSSWIYVCPFLPIAASRMLLATREPYRGFKESPSTTVHIALLSLRPGLIKTPLDISRQHGVAGCCGTRGNLCPKHPERGWLGTSCMSNSQFCVCSSVMRLRAVKTRFGRWGRASVAWPSLQSTRQD